MRKRRSIELFSISFLDLLSGALGAVIILYIAIPKNKSSEMKEDPRIKILRESNQELIQQIENLKRKAPKIVEKKAEPEVSQITVQSNVDVGFSFKGKEILFIIDTSGSMLDEDRIGQVKAGLKMLMTSFPADYKLNIIQFPLGMRAPYKPLWNVLKLNTKENRSEVFRYLYSLYPDGGTPTRDVLIYALENYREISDIVLLTDGVPTLHNSNQRDSIEKILEEVKRKNMTKIRINTIGVGASFSKDTSTPMYTFLSLLAEQNDGFFVGF